MEKKEVVGKVVSGGISIVSKLAKLMPKGGIRTPDSMIRNKSLYSGGGNMPSPITGRIYTGKALLTGYRPSGRSMRRRRR